MDNSGTRNGGFSATGGANDRNNARGGGYRLIQLLDGLAHDSVPTEKERPIVHVECRKPRVRAGSVDSGPRLDVGARGNALDAADEEPQGVRILQTAETNECSVTQKAFFHSGRRTGQENRDDRRAQPAAAVNGIVEFLVLVR